MESKRIIIGVHERPKVGKWLLLSLQHVFAMFGATVLVPLLTGLDVSVALLGSGVGTLIYILCTKAKVPMYLGSSFAYIAAIQAAYTASGNNLGSSFIGIIAIGIVYVIVSIIIYLTGTKWLNWLLPSVIVGPMIIIIGLSLSEVAVSKLTKITNSDGTQSTEIWKGYLVGLVTFITIVIIAIKGKGFLKIIPFIFGIVAGYLMALALGIVDYTKFYNLSFFHLPKVSFIGTYKLDFTALAVFVPLSFVTIMEHIGDHKVLSKIMDTDLIKDPGLHRTLLGDGLATLAAGLIGAPANTSYGENTGVVDITKVASVWVTGLAAVFSILLSFISPVSAFITSIPEPVLGGMSIVLFGLIASNGLKVLKEDNVDLFDMKNIIIIASMLVVGLGGLTIKIAGIDFMKGMSIAAVIGIFLNLIFKLLDVISKAINKKKIKNDNIEFFKKLEEKESFINQEEQIKTK